MHALRSEENTRASRVAHLSRWAQGGALEARSAAVDSSTGLARQRRGRYENRSFISIDLDPVEHEHVHVGIEVQRGTESLDEGYRAPTCAVMTHGLRLTSIPEAQHAEKHRQYLRDPLAVVGQAVCGSLFETSRILNVIVEYRKDGKE